MSARRQRHTEQQSRELWAAWQRARSIPERAVIGKRLVAAVRDLYPLTDMAAPVHLGDWGGGR